MKFNSRFKDSVIIELLVEVAVGTEVTIQSALRGGDVKLGIRYYKVLYKAFLRSKINSLKLLLKSQLDLKTRLILYVTILTMKTVKYYLKNTWMKYQYQQYLMTCQSGCSL